MNIVVMTGRLTRDPDFRVSEEGNKAARYTLAVQRGKDKADFVYCRVFGENAEFVKKYLTKGIKIMVKGSIRAGSYTNKEGNNVNSFEVWVDSHEFCESKQQPTKKPDDGFVYTDDGFDGLPFN